MNHRCWSLRADDLTSLWEECPRCFYLKHVHGLTRPPRLVPAGLNPVDAPMKPLSSNGHGVEIAAAPTLPAGWQGVPAFEERWVQSDPLTLPGRESTVILRGQFDAAVQFDDGTFGLLACTTRPAATEEAIRRHSRRLHACALAAEYATPCALALGKVSRLGLLVIEPDRLTQEPSSSDSAGTAFEDTMRWVDITRDDRAFLQFLDQVVGLLQRPEPPAPSRTCAFCTAASDRQVVSSQCADTKFPGGYRIRAYPLAVSGLDRGFVRQLLIHHADRHRSLACRQQT